MYRRWDKLRKDFRKKSGKFNISKIPDIYDCIKYDYQHNQQFLGYHKSQAFFQCAKFMADLVVPMEYGISVQVGDIAFFVFLLSPYFFRYVFFFGGC